MQLWDVCLQLVDFAGGTVQASFIRQLWDHFMLQAAGKASSAHYGSSLAAAAAAVEWLGAQFYPNDNR